MGCLRLGLTIIGSLIGIAVFTILGGVIGFIFASSAGFYIGGGVGLLLGLILVIASLKRKGHTPTMEEGAEWMRRQQNWYDQQRKQWRGY